MLQTIDTWTQSPSTDVHILANKGEAQRREQIFLTFNP